MKKCLIWGTVLFIGSINSYATTIVNPPNVGVYLTSQYSNLTMFNHAIEDRGLVIREYAVMPWVKIKRNKFNTDLTHQKQRAKVTTDVLQVGVNLFHIDQFIFGIYGGYGRSHVNGRAKPLVLPVTMTVEGYHVGYYASWIADEHKGFYVDLWRQHAWFQNKLKERNGRTTYHSTASTNAIEAGYGIEMVKNNIGRSWLLRPHIQLIYSDYDTANVIDKSLNYYTRNDANTLITNLGTRFYSTNQKITGFAPFIDISWLYYTNNGSVKFNQQRLHSGITKHLVDFKVGVEGYLAKGVNMQGSLGTQRGAKGFELYQGMLGVNYSW